MGAKLTGACIAAWKAAASRQLALGRVPSPTSASEIVWNRGSELPFSMVSEQVAPNSWQQDAELLGKLTQLLQIAMPVLESEIRATLF
jgi:hypothetical protein